MAIMFDDCDSRRLYGGKARCMVLQKGLNAVAGSSR
jgi:hypothetical protein